MNKQEDRMDNEGDRMDNEGDRMEQRGMMEERGRMQEEGRMEEGGRMEEETPRYYAQYSHNEEFRTATLKSPRITHEFKIPAYYNPIKIMGSGSYGVVCAAINTLIKDDPEKEKLMNEKQIKKERRKKYRAIKCIRLRQTIAEGLKRYLREMKILRLIQHPSIVKLKTIVLPHTREDFDELYLAFQFMDTDLGKLIGNRQIITHHIQWYSARILEGMDFLHQCGILHRDLTPNNILIDWDNGVRISDFGLSRAVSSRGDSNLTNYVVTRWYRAPELLCTSEDYGEAIDIWSIGCIIGEMLLGRPLFPSRQDTFESHLKIVFKFTGFKLADLANYNQQMQDYLLRTFRNEFEGDTTELRNKHREGADLVQKMLRINPRDRISLREAMRHPFITEMCSPKIKSPGPIADKMKVEFEFEEYGGKISIEQFKDMIYEQILLYHDANFHEWYMNRVATNQSVIQHILNRNQSP